MVFPLNIWLLFAVALAISAIGFKRYVWFISLGYGFSIAGEGILMLILYGVGRKFTPGTLICCLLLTLYGFRLSGYLAYREVKSASYNRNMTGEIKEDVSTGVKAAIWITCALLYVLEVLPVFSGWRTAAVPERGPISAPPSCWADLSWRPPRISRRAKPRKPIQSVLWIQASTAWSAVRTIWAKCCSGPAWS